MTGEFYLLNALWFGAGLVILGAFMPTLWRVVRFVIIICLPFGLVAGYHVACSIISATREHMRGNDLPDNVTPMPQGKGNAKK